MAAGMALPLQVVGDLLWQVRRERHRIVAFSVRSHGER